MDINKELKILKKNMGGKNEDAFKSQADFINSNFTSEADENAINAFISGTLAEISNNTENLIQKAQAILAANKRLKENFVYN